MAPKECEKLIAELKAWADAEFGRRAEIARMFGVARQRVSDWLAGRRVPTLEQGLQLQTFLKKQGNVSKRKGRLFVKE
jgi:DNA-binding transcriptional regulator YiaG